MPENNFPRCYLFDIGDTIEHDKISTIIKMFYLQVDSCCVLPLKLDFLLFLKRSAMKLLTGEESGDILC